MAKFTRKADEVDAVQYFDWMREQDRLPEDVVILPWYSTLVPEYKPTIPTVDGLRPLRDGDWIITGPRGRYVRDPDVFAATYEPA